MILKFRQTFIGFVFCFCVLMGGTTVRAQDSIFTYQGKLSDNNAAANGTYMMRFELFGAVSGGSQIGFPFEIAAVPVTNGIFTVNLNFDHTGFDGSARFLQITILSGNTLTVLTPRQRITAAPYAIQSYNAEVAKNALWLGGFAAELYAKKDDARFTDSRNPLPGSTNYIRNTSSPQSANFDITGSGTLGGTLSANKVNSVTQYNLDDSRVLFAEFNGQNTFVGFEANGSNSNTGSGNSFFGKYSGNKNTTGFDNSFFGLLAGESNLTGGNNSFFGKKAGDSNTGGGVNSFFGAEAGGGSTTGDFNSFFGYTAGFANKTGSHNTALGADADFGAANLSYATAVGAGVTVSSSNTIILGRAADNVRVPGNLVVQNLGSPGSISLCRNALSQISTCTVGNLAEKTTDETAAKFDALNAQNARMQQQIKQQQILIGGLQKIVCTQNPQAEVCKEKQR